MQFLAIISLIGMLHAAEQPLTSRQENALTALAMTFVAVANCGFEIEPDGFDSLQLYGSFRVRDVPNNETFKSFFEKTFKEMDAVSGQKSAGFCDLAYSNLGPAGGLFQTLRKK